jgi:hypothetical protein
VDVRRARAIVFSPDGKTVAALCYYWANNMGKPTGLAMLIPDRDEPPQFINDASMRSACALAVSADGKHIVTGHTFGGIALYLGTLSAMSATASSTGDRRLAWTMVAVLSLFALGAFNVPGIEPVTGALQRAIFVLALL